eukprot:scaffold2083_cov113-Skeletonema_marinoi.AAC.12
MCVKSDAFVLFLRDTGNRNVKEDDTSYAPWASNRLASKEQMQCDGIKTRVTDAIILKMHVLN